MPSLCYHDPPFGDVVYAGQDLAKVGPSVVTRNGVPLSLEQSQRVWNHSSDGFSWGYQGSGPAQFALEVWPESHWPGFALRQADVLQSYMA